jgi:hypothetical protein
VLEARQTLSLQVSAGRSFITRVAYIRNLRIISPFYDKDEMTDLTPQQRRAQKAMIKAELEARRTR